MTCSQERKPLSHKIRFKLSGNHCTKLSCFAHHRSRMRAHLMTSRVKMAAHASLTRTAWQSATARKATWAPSVRRKVNAVSCYWIRACVSSPLVVKSRSRKFRVHACRPVGQSLGSSASRRRPSQEFLGHRVPNRPHCLVCCSMGQGVPLREAK